MIDIQRRLVQQDVSHSALTLAESKSTFIPISLSVDSNKTDKRDCDHVLSAHDRKLIRSVVKSFDASVNHLRSVIRCADDCLDLRRGRKGASVRTAVSSCLFVALDLGQDPRHMSTDRGSSCFHGKGLYFVVEAYLFPSEQFLQHLKAPSKEGNIGIALVESDLLTRCRRRRSAGCGGILGEGGHFDHLINAHRAFYESTGIHSSQQQSRRLVVASGLRLNLDRVVGLIAKYEMRQSKIRIMRQSKSNNVVGQLSKYSFVDRFRSDLAAVLESGRDEVDVLVCDIDRSPRNSCCSPSPAVLSALTLLRSCGVRATCMLHQLTYSAATDCATAEEACSHMRIPLLCLVQSDVSVVLKVQ